MRLAVFHNAFRGIGGAEVLAMEQAQGLAARGHHVKVYAFDFDARIWAARLGGLELDLVPRHAWTDIPHLLSRAGKWEARGRRALTRMEDAEVVLAHNPPCPAILGRARIPALKAWYCHEPPRRLYPRETLPNLARALAEGPQDSLLEPFRPLAQDWARSQGSSALQADRRYELGGVAGLDRIIANSAFCRDNAARVYGRTDIAVVHPLIPPPPRVPGRQGLPGRGLQILCMSRLELLKNVGMVLRGFAAFRAEDSEAVLHVVGEGREQQALVELAGTLGISSAVRFHGLLGRGDLEALFEACHVFALLSWDEPFGMVFPEAGSRGLLLVGPDHGGPREILEEGDLGWCVPAHHPEGLAEALRAIRALPDQEVDRRREQVARSFAARFAPEALLPRLEALLQPA